jgi:hypothetical protein
MVALVGTHLSLLPLSLQDHRLCRHPSIRIVE